MTLFGVINHHRHWFSPRDSFTFSDLCEPKARSPSVPGSVLGVRLAGHLLTPNTICLSTIITTLRGRKLNPRKTQALAPDPTAGKGQLGPLGIRSSLSLTWRESNTVQQ